MSTIILSLCLLALAVLLFGNKIVRTSGNNDRAVFSDADQAEFTSRYSRYDSARLLQLLQLGNVTEDESSAINEILQERNVPNAGVPLF